MKILHHSRVWADGAEVLSTRKYRTDGSCESGAPGVGGGLLMVLEPPALYNSCTPKREYSVLGGLRAGRYENQ